MKNKYKPTVKHGSDKKGVSYGNYDHDTGELYQENSKTKGGEHFFYNNKTGTQGWCGAKYDRSLGKKKP